MNIYQVPKGEWFYFVAASSAAMAEIATDNRNHLGRSLRPISEFAGVVRIEPEKIPAELIMQMSGAATLPGLEQESMMTTAKMKQWEIFAKMMEPIVAHQEEDCLCLEPPTDDADNPTNHAQYCPHYLYAYALALAEGRPVPE